MPDNHTYVIAEMACSHEGDSKIAEKIIDGAGKAGADAIQFQIWSLKDMVVPHHKDYELLTRIELSREDWKQLAERVRRSYPDMQIIACVYEASSVDFACSIDVDAFKIHSADLSNPNLIHHVAETGKRIDLSIGASTLDEIQTAIGWIKAASEETPVWLMYGYQVFPTPTGAIHLDFMRKLMDMFELPVGYQDHSDGDEPAGFYLPAAAVGMGVACLEKHITHDRSFKGIDHEAALNPEEFTDFIKMVRVLDEAKGVSVPRPFIPQEEAYRKNSKKSIVAAHTIQSGQVIRKSDLLYMRASELGLPPDHAPVIIGKIADRDIDAFNIITGDDVS
ncbi:MAG: hypothetical protein D3926_20585 [Desulfobacteraceae bacterium]|nr:MAG: hypothetical protein D3926_20585 [Desulfobacteraceae bacterium]